MKPGFQFGTRHLLWVVSLFAAGLAIFGPISLISSTGITLFWYFVIVVAARPNVKTWLKSRKLLTIAIILTITMILFAMLMPALQINRGSSRRAYCMNNMKQIVLAIHNYESTNGVLPPAYLADENGKPMHSWRVLLLPFLEGQTVYDQYDFSEPWDGPSNSLLANSLTFPLYQCPSTPQLGTQTTYKLVTGPQSAFPNDEKIGFDDVTDGTSNTIVLIEDSANPVHWMDPSDIGIIDAAAALSQKERVHNHKSDSLFKTVYSGSIVGNLDGSVLSISPLADAKTFAEAMTIAGGETGTIRAQLGPHVVPKPQAYIALAAYLLLAVLPGWTHWRRKRLT